MNKEEKEKLVQQFLDGTIDDSREAEALRIMAEEQELRELLRLEIDLNHAFRRQTDEATSFDVPEGFSEEVMEAVKQRESAEQKEEEKVGAGIGERLKQTVDLILTPRTVQWRPAYGVAAVLLTVALFIGLSLQDNVTPSSQKMAQNQGDSPANTGQAVQVASTTSETPELAWARFFYVNEEAESVAIAGDFSDWEPIPLDQKEVNGKKVWTGNIQMERGEHRYMYIIDGETWKTDPLATRYKEDGFGHRNAVISL
jgi:hypothetical protein